MTAVIDQPYESFRRKLVPCFGLSFANYVHTRIFLTRADLVIKEAAIVSRSENKETAGKWTQFIP